ncbi:MAG: molecular chaperone HtpG [Cytophagales bacterium]|nr:MAG: molecular chaperone HtpG [Cytophagales bacterium]
MEEKGTISVSTENIFPIIKKFLYSDHEIFLRELVSNAIDATQKLKRLSSIGEYQGELGDLKVIVRLDTEAKTITISDEGIGMTAEEIKKYINQIAFSGATEFVEKYKDKFDEKQIIGHFGLGFYSAFMVAEKVVIRTKSYQANTQAAQWTCEGNTSFSIETIEKEQRGTDIILHISEESSEFLDKSKIQQILEKYGKFLPIAVEFEDKIINNTNPLWTKNPNDLKDEDYINFYKELYPFAEEPLFWIHLNVDYPFNLTGVLYFPKIKSNLDIQKEKIQLYSRQVFITDEVKGIVPEFLMLMHGIIDSPDIPLNVSRSYLQADGNVKKITSYITRKVGDKLTDLFKSDRAIYEKKWESIGLFVKYGIISEEKFYEKAQHFALLKNTQGEYFTFEEYKTKVAPLQTDKNNRLVWLYTTDTGKQDLYIQSALKKGYDVLAMEDAMIDNHFIGALERKLENTSLKRVDADTIDKIIETEIQAESILSQEKQDKLKEIFKNIINDAQVSIELSALSPDDSPVMLTIPEFMRRMREMASGMQAFLAQMNDPSTLTINTNHALMEKVLGSDEATQKAIVQQLYDLALLSQNLLSGEKLTSFIQRTTQMI